MPDHIHYLLIVDYDRDRNINPLFISHRVADVVEMAVAEEWTGAHAPAPPTNTCAIAPTTGAAAAPTTEAAAPEFNADELVDKMAGLFKFAIRLANIRAAASSLKEEHGLKFGEIVCDIPTAIGDGKAIMGAEAPVDGTGARASSGGAGARAPVRSVVFARECHIELSFDSRQLKAIRHYIRLNPARSIWKRRHPDLFLCHRAIKSKRLASFAPMSFDGIGALTLLGSPFLFHVRLTLKKTVAEHSAAIDEIIEKARLGMVPVSGFISPGEKEALRRLKAEPRSRFIKLLPYALPTRYDPSAEDSREIAAGRLLILSCFRDTPPISSLEMKRNPSAAHAFRRNCLAMNDIAARLCL